MKEGLTADAQESKEGHQNPNVRVHDTEGDHGYSLSNHIIDEEVAAARQCGSHQAWNASCNAFHFFQA